MAKLREEVGNSGRAFEESKQQLASLAEAKMASLNQAAADAAGSLEAAMAKLRKKSAIPGGPSRRASNNWQAWPKQKWPLSTRQPRTLRGALRRRWRSFGKKSAIRGVR